MNVHVDVITIAPVADLVPAFALVICSSQGLVEVAVHVIWKPSMVPAGTVTQSPAPPVPNDRLVIRSDVCVAGST